MNRRQTVKLHTRLLVGLMGVALLFASLAVGVAALPRNVELKVPTVEQKLNPPVVFRGISDDGRFNCVPASIAMVLQYLKQQGSLTGVDAEYKTVLREFRKLSLSPAAGINPGLAVTVVPALTNSLVGASIVLTDTNHWQSAIERELSAGFPVFAVVPDWRLLAGPARPGTSLAHAIVVTGLKDGKVLYNDPWDGVRYSQTVDEFGRAWAMKTNDGIRYGGLTFALNRQPGPAPASPQALIEESAGVMRELKSLNVDFQADLLALSAEGNIAFARPDVLNGRGDFAGVTWSASTDDGRTEFSVNDQAITTVPSADVAPHFLDAILQLPTVASDWTMREEGEQYRLEGKLTPEALEAVESVTGLVIPGNPNGRLILTVDKSARVWRESRLLLTWPIFQRTVLGRQFEFGPTASITLKFAVKPP